LAERYGIAADVWSVTSYNELRREALRTERWNRLHPGEAPRRPYVVSALGSAQGPIVAATDYMKVVPDQVAPWLPGRMVTLGTDGFGRSENREYLRRHFEVNAESIVTLRYRVWRAMGSLTRQRRRRRFEELGVNTRGDQRSGGRLSRSPARLSRSGSTAVASGGAMRHNTSEC
jgi:pyruvate dehydrogenase E1 component